MPAQPKPKASTDHQAQLRPLMERAREGDQTVLPAIREMLDHHPEIWRECGDLAKYAELTILSLIAKDDPFVNESVRRYAAELRSELAGPSPTPLEGLLIQRIVVCWLALYHADVSSKPEPEDAWTLLSTERKEKRHDSAHRRFLQAVKVLADVRRLMSLTRPLPEREDCAAR